MHQAIKLASDRGLIQKLKKNFGSGLGRAALGFMMPQLFEKIIAKATAAHKPEGSNNVTLSTKFQKQTNQTAKPVQTQAFASQPQPPATPTLPQSQDALSRRNLSILQRKSLDSTEYEDPNDNLVSFKRKK